MKRAAISPNDRSTPACYRSRRVAAAGLALFAFAIATVDTAEAASDFVLDNASAEPLAPTDA